MTPCYPHSHNVLVIQQGKSGSLLILEMQEVGLQLKTWICRLFPISTLYMYMFTEDFPVGCVDRSFQILTENSDNTTRLASGS